MVLLWLWSRLGAAASIQPLAWELLYVISVAVKKKKKKERKERQKNPLSWDRTLWGMVTEKESIYMDEWVTMLFSRN